MSERNSDPPPPPAIRYLAICSQAKPLRMGAPETQRIGECVRSCRFVSLRVRIDALAQKRYNAGLRSTLGRSNRIEKCAWGPVLPILRCKFGLCFRLWCIIRSRAMGRKDVLTHLSSVGLRRDRRAGHCSSLFYCKGLGLLTTQTTFVGGV